MLYVHPFAEEMNKARRMAALQARALAAAGWTVLQVDLAGCGDSEGEFGEASWDRWVADVREAVGWLRERSGREPWLWGLRAGCLVASEAAIEMASVPGLLFWQPVLSGKQFLQQFLRLKLASQILGSAEAARVDTRELRERLLRGDSVEVAGYELSPALAAGLEAADLAPIAGACPVAWIEVTGATEAQMSPAGRARVGAVGERRPPGGRALRHRAGFLADAGNHRMPGADPRDRRRAGRGPLVSASEQALTFECGGERLVGIVAVPEQPAPVGVLIVVGGPQYRAGSHRQFVHLARRLAREGIAAMRFDYRGMGDAGGEARSFEDVSEDIAAAIAAFRRACPAVEQFVLWGLCDAASAALMYIDASRDASVAGVVLVNPWVRSEATLAKTRIKHYYARRLLERDFWAKLLRGRVRVGDAVAGVAASARNARRASGARQAAAPPSLSRNGWHPDCRRSPDRSCC